MASVEITVSDVNDNLPYFNPRTTQFTVRENVDIGLWERLISVVFDPVVTVFISGTEVGTVIATDADIGSNGILKYSLANPSDAFRIDTDKGE